MNMSTQGDTQKKIEHLETLNKTQDDRIQELNAMVGMEAIWYFSRDKEKCFWKYFELC